jgi:archaellum component FlaG (FlaF/FlaG flagellin family)
MGFDGIAGQAIMFIAVLGASTLLVSIFSSQVSTSANAIVTKQNALEQQILSAVSIELVTYVSSNNTLIAYVKNTGTVPLDQNMTGFYIDAERAGNASITIAPDTNTKNPAVWDPQEVLSVVIEWVLDPASEYTFKVVSAYQSSDTEGFST